MFFEERADNSCTPGLLVGEHPNLFADCDVVSAGVNVSTVVVKASRSSSSDVPVGSFEAILQL